MQVAPRPGDPVITPALVAEHGLTPDEYERLVRLLGRTPEFVRFPGESHELSRSGSPRHRVERAEVILDFFRHHLG